MHTVTPLLRDQQERWSQGESRLVETYLEQEPALKQQPLEVLELIFNEITIRMEHGDPPGLREYLRRFPQFGPQLQARFKHLDGDENLSKTIGISPEVAASDAPLLPRFPGYELLEELGRGGMGVVYKARQLSLKRLVALKIVRSGAHADAKELARFRIEAEAVARLQHPNIVRIYEVGEHDGIPYLSLELIAGPTLEALAGRKPMPARQAAHIVETLARAMHYAHQQGIVHLDLKPSNVLFDQGAGQDVPKITDFGLAKVVNGEPAQQRTEAIVGTPQYMAPEQTLGEAVTGVTDVYALGAVLYELLTGRPPFQAGKAHKVLEMVRRQEPTPPSKLQPYVPRDLETICLKCLEKEPGRRYASGLDLGEDLRRFLAHELIRARPAAVWDRALKWTRRHPAVAGLAAVGLLCALLLLTVQVRHNIDLDTTAVQSRNDERLKQADALQKSRQRYQQFLQLREEAQFQEVRRLLFPIGAFDRNREAVRQTIAEGLALAGMKSDGTFRPFRDPYLTDAENAEIVGGCYQLLHLLAEEAAKENTREALALLDRAEPLMPPTRAAFVRRARYQRQAPGSEAASIQPSTMVDYFMLGEEHYRAENIPAALQAFQKALILQPGDFWSQYFLAACQLKMGRAAEAEVRLSKCLEQKSGFLWTHLLRGMAYEQLNNLEAAEADFDAALKRGADDQARYVVFVTRGLLHFRRHRLEQAADDLEKAVALIPDRFHALISLARVYQAQKRFGESNRCFDGALQLKPPHHVAAECHAERSRNLCRNGQFAEALNAADAALQVWRDYPEGHLRRAFALQALKQHGSAAASFDHYLEQGGNPNVEFYRGRGQARLQLGDFLGARDDFTHGLDIEPDPQLLTHRGWAYFFADAWRPALGDFEAALNRDADYCDAIIGRGLALVMLGRPAEAIADAENALRRPPATPEMTHNVACIFALAAGLADKDAPKENALAKRCRDQAMQAIEATLALVPGDEQAAFWRDKIFPDAALNALREHGDFKKLTAQFGQR